MTKIRALTELSDYLARQWTWRKRELTTIRFRIARDREHQRATSLRGAVCLLYAHWEGFVKKAAEAYVCFVGCLGLRLADLSPGFLTLALRDHLADYEQSRNIPCRMKLVSVLLSDMSAKARIQPPSGVAATSNLNVRQLGDILSVLGLDDTEYRKSGLLIDGRLLKWRNGIAHGEGMRIDEKDYLDLQEKVITLLERFRTDIENAATTQGYRR